MLMSGSAVSVNGIPEGNKLRQLAQLLQIPPNQDLPEPITVDTAGGPVNFANLQLTVVGPTQANLDALRDEWQKWLDKHENGIANGDPKVMANADRSVPNLSSICVVAAADGHTILLPATPEATISWTVCAPSNCSTLLAGSTLTLSKCRITGAIET
jgi:hypothetical protein